MPPDALTDAHSPDVVWFELDEEHLAAIESAMRWLEAEDNHEAADYLRPILAEEQPTPPEGARIVAADELDRRRFEVEERLRWRESWAAEDAGFDPSGTDLFAEFACAASMPRARATLPGRSIAVRRRRRSTASGKPREPDPDLADRRRP